MAKSSFIIGWKKLPKETTTTVKEEIKIALNIKSDPQFYRRMQGRPEPTVSEAEAITEIFNRHGVMEIWQ
ncbi:MAG: hypothetical protein ACI3Z0_03045 [Candidatus Cryptobacteroides sp.]